MRLILLKKFFTSPQSMGTILPSSNKLGKAVSEIVDTLENLHVIEIGAGTGALTQHLIKYLPTIVELEPDLYKILKEKFPNQKVQNSCCLNVLGNQTEKFGLVSSIPTINNPIKDDLINVINDKYRNGLLKWCVVYTYGLQNPLKETDFRHHKRQKLVLNNIPPAHIWVYY